MSIPKPELTCEQYKVVLCKKTRTARPEISLANYLQSSRTFTGLKTKELMLYNIFKFFLNKLSPEVTMYLRRLGHNFFK
jgi:hypothetical protein